MSRILPVGFADVMLNGLGTGLEEGRAKKQRGMICGDLAEGNADKRAGGATDKRLLLFAKVEAQDAAGRQAAERAANI
jgi:hypothetical protein